MNGIIGLLQWINDLPVSESIRETSWAFPALETIHVVAIVMVVGSITRMDMRLMGLVWTKAPSQSIRLAVET